jgi:hypothetical protein
MKTEGVMLWKRDYISISGRGQEGVTGHKIITEVGTCWRGKVNEVE